MKIRLIQIGKTSEKYLIEGISSYEKRIQGFASFQSETIPTLKNAGSLSPQMVKQKEGDLILSKIRPDEFIILLDERGKEFSSRAFAEFMQQQMNLSTKQVSFVIGGAFGFSEEVYLRSNYKLSMSKMTYSHQLIRLIFAEQIYRCYSIINNHPYHND
ncbi:MAG: 23S rRNA (pseudouridine(1915)-N(3))-methyltransferase RlmH [Bacteroidia bacterium]